MCGGGSLWGRSVWWREVSTTGRRRYRREGIIITKNRAEGEKEDKRIHQKARDQSEGVGPGRADRGDPVVSWPPETYENLNCYKSPFMVCVCVFIHFLYFS